MAAKPTKPRKFKQARKDAKADAKKVFRGKPQARLKDPTLKVSADDLKAIKDVKSESRNNFITDDRGNRIQTQVPTETAQERFDREGRQANEKFREQMRAEGLYEDKKKPEATKKAAVKKTAPVKKAAVKKAAVKKAAAPKPAAEKPSVNKPSTTGDKKMTRAEKSAANKAKWAKMSPTERKNWKASGKPVPTTAVAEPTKTMSKAAMKEQTRKAMDSIARSTRPTDASLRKNEDAYLKKTKARLDAKKPSVKPAAADAKPKAKSAPKATSKKFRKTKAVGKFVAKRVTPAIIAGELVSLAKGSTVKDLNEINRLKAKLGNKGMSAKEGAATQASNLANLVTFGAVGQTRRQRMDELNAKISKEEAKKAKANKGLRYGPRGESLVPGTAAYKAGSTTRPSMSATGAGGSTTTTPSSRYTVKRGDTLSGIAKAAGVTLAEVRAANPVFKTNAKYKNGNVIFAGTKVKIPTKKK